MTITHVFAGLPTAALEPALAWSERFLGRPPDRLPNDKEAVWQLSDTGLIYVVADPERAGRGLLTLIVADLDSWLTGLAQRGIEASAVDTTPGGVRRCALKDPDGNRIQLGQVEVAV